jgi:PmbA protein
MLALAQRVVEMARKSGAREAEAYAEKTREASVKVRDGEIEDLTEATGKGLGLRVIKEGRLGFAYTSDFSDAALEAFVQRALALAKAAAKDPNNKLPSGRGLKKLPATEGLYDPAVADLDPGWKIRAAREAEAAARAADLRIQKFDAAGAGEYVAESAVASSHGVAAESRGTYVYVYAAPVATDGAQLQTSYWLDYKRHFADLETPEAVGRRAAERAARMLGARKAKTTRVPVVFDPFMAASFIAGLAGAVNGDMIYKKASFLAGRLGEPVASPLVNIVDDGLLARGLATSPFDGEGVPRRRTPIIEDGVLKSFLYDSYTARKAGAATTGSASRSYASLPSIGVSNFFMPAGATPAAEIVRGVKDGFYVTAMLGRGANTVTGDYSRGANGLWIVDGELAYPVQEVTVAGHLLEMLKAIDAVGDDLDFRGAIAAPTIRFAELTVSGG